MLISIIGNILIVVVIKKTKEFTHSQFVYKKSIAISDIILTLSVCIIVVILVYCFGNTFYTCQISNLSNALVIKNNLTVYRDVYCEYSYKQVDHIFGSSFLFVISTVLFILSWSLLEVSLKVSLVLLIFAAADRYFALAFPFRYRSTNTIKLAKRSSIIIWILITLLNLITFLYNIIKTQNITFLLQPLIFETDTFHNIDNPHQIFVSVLVFVLFSLLWLLTLLTLVSLYKTYKRSSKLNRRTRKKIAPEKQMSLVLIVMVIAFTFSLSPTLCNNILLYIKIKHVVMVDPRISLLFLLTNPFWNILVYNVLNKKFRTALKALFKKTN